MEAMRLRCLPLVALAIALSGCCKGDTGITTVSEYGPFKDKPTCDTARTTVATACPVITSDPGCTAYCKSSSYPGGCLAKVVNPSGTAVACFPKQADNLWYYQCTNQATCHCL